MLLAVDVGNTHTVIGLYDGQDRIADWRITTRKERTSDELGVLITNLFKSHSALVAPEVTRAIVSSVVPASQTLSSEWFCSYSMYTKLSDRD